MMVVSLSMSMVSSCVALLQLSPYIVASVYLHVTGSLNRFGLSPLELSSDNGFTRGKR